MGNKDFLSFLRRVGFEDTVTGCEKSWLTHNKIFQWLGEHMTEDDFVSLEDLRLYDELQSGGTAGEQGVDGAVDLFSAMGLEDPEGAQDREEEDRWLSAGGEEVLKDKISAKRKELQKLEMNSQALQRCLDGLGAETSKASQLAPLYSQRLSWQQQEVTQAEATVMRVNDEVNYLLGELTAKMRELQELVTNHPQQWLLGCLNMKMYVQQDKGLKRQFERIHKGWMGPPDLDVKMSDQDEDLGHVDPFQQDPLDRFVRGPTHGRQEEFNKELTRLRHAHNIGQHQRMEALSRQANAEAQLAVFERLLSHCASGLPDWVLPSERQGTVYRQEIRQWKAKKLASLDKLKKMLAESARLQDTYILEGDYDLKLYRLDYYFDRRVVYIEKLLHQSARHLVVDLLMKQEQQELEQLRGMLQECSQRLQQIRTACQERHEEYKRLNRGPGYRQGPGTRDPSDMYMSTLYRSIVPQQGAVMGSAGRGTAITSQLKKALQSSHYTEVEDHTNLTTTLKQIPEVINDMKDATLTVHQLLFDSPSSCQPVLTHPSLQDAMDTCTNLVQEVSTLLTGIREQERGYAAALASSSEEAQKERELWKLFFASPEELRARVEDARAYVRQLQALGLASPRDMDCE